MSGKDTRASTNINFKINKLEDLFYYVLPFFLPSYLYKIKNNNNKLEIFRWTNLKTVSEMNNLEL